MNSFLPVPPNVEILRYPHGQRPLGHVDCKLAVILVFVSKPTHSLEAQIIGLLSEFWAQRLRNGRKETDKFHLPLIIYTTQPYKVAFIYHGN